MKAWLKRMLIEHIKVIASFCFVLVFFGRTTSKLQSGIEPQGPRQWEHEVLIAGPPKNAWGSYFEEAKRH